MITLKKMTTAHVAAMSVRIQQTADQNQSDLIEVIVNRRRVICSRLMLNHNTELTVRDKKYNPSCSGCVLAGKACSLWCGDKYCPNRFVPVEDIL